LKAGSHALLGFMMRVTVHPLFAGLLKTYSQQQSRRWDKNPSSFSYDRTKKILSLSF
jgi:hypothetical protein